MRLAYRPCASTSPSRPAEEAAAPLGIVVDVLRATSTIAQALASGYRRVLCCAEIEEARRLRARAPRARSSAASATPCAIDGLRRRRLAARVPRARARETLILSTTNGTRAILDRRRALRRGAARLAAEPRARSRAAARERGEDVAVLCAGFKGEFALDDAYCAGRIVALLGAERSDAAIAAS